MPLPNTLDWISRRFDAFSIVYLDSLICELASTTTWWSRHVQLTQTSTQRFANQLTSQLKVKPEETVVTSYLDPNGLGTRFKKDHDLQRAITELIEQELTTVRSGSIRSFDSLDRFFDQRSTLLGKGAPAEVLVALDTMFACRIILPEETNLALPAQIEDDPRSVECVLTDQHPKLLTLYDRHIVLSVDRRAFYEWTTDFTRILTVGWHPFTRTIGYYTTSAGGQPFIRVLAILMRPYPLIREVLLPRRSARTHENMQTVLANNLDAIGRKIKEYQTATAAPPVSVTGHPATIGTAHPSAPATASTVHPPTSTSTQSGISPAPSIGPTAPATNPPTPPTAHTAIPGGSPPSPPTGAPTSNTPSSSPTSGLVPTTAATGSTTPITAPTTPPPGGVPSAPLSGVTQSAGGPPTPSTTHSTGTGGTSPVPPGRSKTVHPPPGTASTGATRTPTATTPARLTLTEYRQFMYPIYMTQLLCGLNGISGLGLRRGARPTYNLLRAYLEKLQELHEYKDFLSSQVLEMAPPDGIETLLEEPRRSNGQDLMLYD